MTTIAMMTIVPSKRDLMLAIPEIISMLKFTSIVAPVLASAIIIVIASDRS